ncbi:hydantoinase B/oxoprolinase family protein [Halobacterium sp. KA-6]|uniref:hydantoinase B/oxoprolinase family protein n=1 Tax=Halobacterium sp. KA-6 TaxID=2896368 RepID=UPI001E354A61|nr:hydantoinase B/oxoprolinase family protein [Halobacterium sp. KA-6]MCD2204590.1 hydantoinase B/oxoprolinase family protein [Halobacterium sp. KA-6]
MVSAGELEIFRHSLEGAVEEMGVTLQRTAYSTNIKIRRDHTCALFDADLRHIAQHDVAPQHIGSLVSVVPRNFKDRLKDLEPGDGFLVNDPYKGAVHLPDVMLISPLFHNDELIGVAANSAHHVDIGGGTPGGIPTDSTDLYGEGIILPLSKAVEDWEYNETVLDLIRRNVRGAEMRLGDYRAQLGANRIGEQRYSELVADYGADTVETYLDELFDATEDRVRAAIADLPDGTYEASDYLDGDGVVDEPVCLKLAITVEDDELTVDFTGTAEQNEGPLNCTPAMIFSGTMSVIMALLGADLPKNDGFYRPFEFITPEGTMVNPKPQAPVASGWEIPMRAGELVTKAMADALPDETIAASKGIVCNIAYGGDDPRDDGEYVYYETVAGGYGARKEKDGMEAVQTHFQNTANSPIEELEREVPLYVRRYELIQDSAGAGRTRGGLGVRRDMEFYDHQTRFSILSDRAKSSPWGLFGGESGRRAHYVMNPDTDNRKDVSSKSTTTLDSGGVASIQTPGGGGYGDALERNPEAVLEDVRDEKVSVEAAREAYGVIVTNDGNLDRKATRDRREVTRAARSDGEDSTLRPSATESEDDGEETPATECDTEVSAE